MDVATCVFGDCLECALRQIEACDLSPHSCHGGIDARDASFHTACTSCYERLYPATQDYQDAELAAFLEGATHAEVDHQIQEDDMSAEQVWQDFQSWNEARWPHVTLPPDRERVEEGVDGPVLMRIYKPFKINKHEYSDFRDFLGLIF
jgi:hypothetical protein